jgi:hypothetical protein
MKRQLLIVMLMVLLTSLACSFMGYTIGKTASLEESSAPVMPTSKVSGVGQAPTLEPSATPYLAKQNEFLDNFDIVSADWTEPMWLTTQAMPGKEHTKISYEDGWLKFEFFDKETYIYQFNQRPTDANVLVEARMQAGGQMQNGVALVCRAATDYSAWYEFRVSSSGDYAIYRYDKSLKDDDKNPYVLLKKGVSEAIKPMKENVMRVMCKDTTLSLEMNGKPVVTVQNSDLKEGGLVGLGAMSADVMPVVVRFDYFSVTTP